MVVNVMVVIKALLVCVYLKDGETALIKAAEKGHMNIVNKLLDSDASINAFNRVRMIFLTLQ